MYLCRKFSCTRETERNLSFLSFAKSLQKIIDNIMNKDVLDFVTYCIGSLSRRLNLPIRDVYQKLMKSGILYGYIVPSYDVLHTFGREYLMEDLTSFMKEKGVL